MWNLTFWTIHVLNWWHRFFASYPKGSPPPPCANLSCDRGFLTRHVLKHREHVLLLSFMKLYCLSSFAVFALLAVVFKTRKSRVCNCSLCPLYLEFSTVGYARFVLCRLLLIRIPVKKAKSDLILLIVLTYNIVVPRWMFRWWCVLPYHKCSY
jgi:hypothetical protein